MAPVTREECVKRDAEDPLAGFRDEFRLPEGVVYLDGNSLGALPAAVPGRVADLIEREWGQGLVSSWNDAGWWDKPRTLGALLAPLLGAGADEVVVGDGVSANIFKLLVAGLRMNPGRTVLLGEDGNFPTDLYVTQGAAEVTGASERRAPARPDALEEALSGGDVAVLLLSHVDYRTGELRDMAAVTELAHRHGALVVWDLCHSAGAVPVDLDGCGADFAVGCTYKYLNAGPGAPGFVYAARRHQPHVRQPLSGWHGHARPFAFEAGYHPAEGASRLLSGSQPLVADAALEASLELFSRVDMAQVRAKSLALSELFISIAAPGGTGPDGLRLVTPADPARRGSQVSLAHPQGHPIVQALIARGVIGDFRAPDVLRFGFTPLYLGYTEVFDAATALVEVVETGEWRDPRFSRRSQVT